MHCSHFNRSIVFLASCGLFLVAATPLTAAPLGEASVPSTPFDPADLDDRAACERALEAVRHDLRLWPAQNPGVRSSFEATVPDPLLRQRALDVLLQTAALEQLWNLTIEPRHLQDELDRMARESRRPQVLGRLFAALGDDPERAAECLARPALADRWLRERFEIAPPERFGERLDAEGAEDDTAAFDRWWRSAAPLLASARPAPAHLDGFVYRLPELERDDPFFDPKGLAGDADLGSWRPTPSLPLPTEGEMVWTGSEVLLFSRYKSLGYSYDPATDRWRPLSAIDAPSSRRDFTAVWTGTEVIIWGGCSATNHGCTLGTGGRYDPVSDTWRSTALGPIARVRHGAVWSGTEMLVFGGCTFVGDICSNTPDDGARYDPATDSWMPMTDVGAPPGHTFVGLVWTGEEMIVWDGQGVGGGRYDPATDTWSPVSEVDAPPGRLTTVVWTGEEMIAWGGCTGTPQCVADQSTGGRYDPRTDTWTPTSLAGAPGPRVRHTAVWTGDAMIVWGGADESEFFGDGARYDPDTDSWAPVSAQNDPTPRRDHLAVWTGSEMIVWGGVGVGGEPAMRAGKRYDPQADRWASMQVEDPGSLRHNHTAVWTGAEMIVWGGLGNDTDGGPLTLGLRYDPALADWSPLPPDDFPVTTWHSMIWTGSEVVLWSGAPSGTSSPGEGRRFDPSTRQWSPTSTVGAPVGRFDHTAVWTGTEMVVWGGSLADGSHTDTGGRYDPGSDTWTPTSLDGAPEPRTDHAAVWTGGGGGGEMIVWGGTTPTTSLGTGGRYDPTTDSWSPTSPVDAPTPRTDHSLVWTGDRMLVWGGIRRELTPSALSELGHRYDPSADAWTQITTTEAPSPRIGHTAVWTGDEMIVWGACDDETACSDPTEAGGRYDPSLDDWSPIAVDRAPAPRGGHTAVWTGHDMIVFGGVTLRNGITNTGAVYTPPTVTTLFADGFESGTMDAWLSSP